MTAYPNSNIRSSISPIVLSKYHNLTVFFVNTNVFSQSIWSARLLKGLFFVAFVFGEHEHLTDSCRPDCVPPPTLRRSTLSHSTPQPWSGVATTETAQLVKYALTAGDISVDWNSFIAGDTSMAWGPLITGDASMIETLPSAWDASASWDSFIAGDDSPAWGPLTVVGKDLMVSQHTATNAREPKLASKVDWITHRQLITNLYSTMTLPRLMRHMEEEHAFKAT